MVIAKFNLLKPKNNLLIFFTKPLARDRFNFFLELNMVFWMVQRLNESLMLFGKIFSKIVS